MKNVSVLLCNQSTDYFQFCYFVAKFTPSKLPSESDNSDLVMENHWQSTNLCWGIWDTYIPGKHFNVGSCILIQLMDTERYVDKLSLKLNSDSHLLLTHISKARGSGVPMQNSQIGSRWGTLLDRNYPRRGDRIPLRGAVCPTPSFTYQADAL